MSDMMNLIIQGLTALATIIPVIYATISLFRKYIKEKNWAKVMTLVMEYCQEAEKLLSDGAQKKQWVMNALIASGKMTGYDLNDEAMAQISDLIDKLIDASRNINVTKAENAEKK
jgi:translation initiation factor 2B subunit (eIF-2B alpha/beta/delta family)